MLVGRATKNAIPIVEIARMGVKQGKPLVDATLEGALSRQVMSSVVIGGMTTAMAMAIAIFLIPVTLLCGRKMDTPRRKHGAI